MNNCNFTLLTLALIILLYTVPFLSKGATFIFREFKNELPVKNSNVVDPNMVDPNMVSLYNNGNFNYIPKFDDSAPYNKNDPSERTEAPLVENLKMKNNQTTTGWRWDSDGGVSPYSEGPSGITFG